MKKITISEGFHNAPETHVRVSERAYSAFIDVIEGITSVNEWAECFLTKSQESRIRKHFCGNRGCSCGSYARATWEYVSNDGYHYRITGARWERKKIKKNIRDYIKLPAGYTMHQSMSGYWRLIDRKGDLVIDDPACEDYYDEESALYYFYSFLVGEEEAFRAWNKYRNSQ